MSWTLGIDTSSTNLSLGLLHNGVPHLSFSRFVKNSHSEHITDVIKSFLTLADIKATDISRCAVVTGPGSFTGLRIGISFVKGLFASGNTQIFPLSSLENMAMAYPMTDGIINVLIDARQDNLFFAQFKKENGLINRIEEDKKITVSEFYDLLNEEHFTLYDPAGNLRSTAFESLNPQRSSSLEKLNLSTGLSAALRAMESPESPIWDEAINIFPNYMQESYAERVRKQ